MCDLSHDEKADFGTIQLVIWEKVKATLPKNQPYSLKKGISHQGGTSEVGEGLIKGPETRCIRLYQTGTGGKKTERGERENGGGVSR